MSKLIRYRQTNGGELFIETQSANPIAVILRLVFCWVPGSEDWFWKSDKVLDCLSYKIHHELNKLAAQFQNKLKELEQVDEYINVQKRDVQESKRATKGYSAPFRIDSKIWDQIKKIEIVDKPEPHWMKVFNMPKNKRRSTLEKLGLSGNELGGFNNRGSAPPRMSAVTLEDFKRSNSYNFDRMAEEEGIDEVYGWKTGDHGKGGKEGNVNPYSKKKLKGEPFHETDASHQARQKAIKDGTFNPDNWNYQM